MPLEEPSWWYGDPGNGSRRSRLLSPVARIVASLAVRRFQRTAAYRSKLPVICIGNFTVGGTGKTPATQFVVRHLLSCGQKPVILSRGYGGRLKGPIFVDPARHTAKDVGDEPLLHASIAPVAISARREEGARFIEQGSPAATVIVMDDGMQNPGLAKDLVIALVDARRGFGNGKVIPAGPLRAGLNFQLGLASCVIINGEAQNGPAENHREQLAAKFHGPVLNSRTRPRGDVTWLTRAPVLAYAGIANPTRFFRLIESLGAQMIGEVAFADHRDFSAADATALLSKAAASGAQLVTTEKDLARLAHADGQRAGLRAASRALPIELAFDAPDEARLKTLIDEAIKRQYL